MVSQNDILNIGKDNIVTHDDYRAHSHDDYIVVYPIIVSTLQQKRATATDRY